VFKLAFLLLFYHTKRISTRAFDEGEVKLAIRGKQVILDALERCEMVRVGGEDLG